MLKLIRNCFGSKKMLIDAQEQKILWHYLQMLQDLQKREGLRCGNKLKQRHLNWQAEKMNVRLAAQLLSNSVADSLTYCENQNIIGFADASHTAVFCKTINNCFDILNSRNIFSKNPFSQKISLQNIDSVIDMIKHYIAYIEGLKLQDGRSIINSERKTGFLGFIICLQNSIELFKLLNLKTDGQFKYLLTYKLSQDHLEVFFSALRSRGGFNNNPTAYQFRNAYRRLLGRHQISGSEKGNCLNFEGIEILNVESSNAECSPDSIFDESATVSQDTVSDHDYISTMWKLTPYVEDTLKYISGFVSKAVKKLIHCEFCVQLLFGCEDTCALNRIKNRGGLTISSKDVQLICRTCEMHYRPIENNLKNSDITKFQNNIFQLINTIVFNKKEIFNHISEQDIFSNHRTQLIRLIIKKYLQVRIHHTNKQISEKNNYIRHKFTKLILFNNQ